MDTLLATPPTPPPPVVETDLSNAVGVAPWPLRARLESHRSKPGSNPCHGVIDPIGLALENFDAIGRWRDEENGQAIDASSRLVDGTAVDGAADLREALLGYSESFAQTVTEKLMTYALGRGLDYYDMPAVRAIVRGAAENDYRFSSIVMGIVKSDAFRMRAVERPPEATEIVAERQ
jgi:hypothetical protein